MKTLFILICFLSPCTLFSQFQNPVVRPPVDQNLNTTPPYPDLPPAPNAPDPYHPFGSIDGRTGSAFSDANATAMHFLNIMDNNVFEGAWLDAGGIVQDVITQEVWAAGMRATRTHLGVVRARRVLSHHTRKALRGGLVGDFMIIEYATEFAKRPNAVETVTLMMHPPLGLWKVVGYKNCCRGHSAKWSGYRFD